MGDWENDYKLFFFVVFLFLGGFKPPILIGTLCVFYWFYQRLGSRRTLSHPPFLRFAFQSPPSGDLGGYSCLIASMALIFIALRAGR